LIYRASERILTSGLSDLPSPLDFCRNECGALSAGLLFLFSHFAETLSSSLSSVARRYTKAEKLLVSDTPAKAEHFLFLSFFDPNLNL
jgi:hypothetical protein